MPNASVPNAPVAPADGRIVRTGLDEPPQPEEVRDALAILFNTPYEHLYMTSLSLHSGSSPEDLHAMGAAYVMARKRLEAGLARELLTPVAALPPFGSYYDHDARRPHGIDLTRP